MSPKSAYEMCSASQKKTTDLLQLMLIRFKGAFYIGYRTWRLLSLGIVLCLTSISGDDVLHLGVSEVTYQHCNWHKVDE